MFEGLLAQKLRAACIALSFLLVVVPVVLAQPNQDNSSQVLAAANKKPKAPPLQLIPTTPEAERLAQALSSLIKPDLGGLSASGLALRAAESTRGAQQDAISQLKALLEQFRGQQRDIKSKIKTTPPLDKKQIKKLKQELAQVEKKIKAPEGQLATLLAKHEIEKKGKTPPQQDSLSGGRFTFNKPDELGERMPGTYTTRNGTVFAATLLRDKDTWIALVRTKAASAGDVIAKNDTKDLKALGFNATGLGGEYHVLVFDKESDPKAAVARKPSYLSSQLSEGAVVKFLNLANKSNELLGAGIPPASALVAIAMQPAPFAGGGRPPEPAPPLPPPPPLPPLPTFSAPPPPCTSGPGEDCENDVDCCDLAHPAAKFVCEKRPGEEEKRCLPTCHSRIFDECGPDYGPCCSRSFEDTPLECTTGSTPNSTLKCRPKCPSDKPYDPSTRRCQCPDPAKVFNGVECVTPTPIPTSTPSGSITPTPTPRPSVPPARGGCVIYGRFGAPRCIPDVTTSRECNPINGDSDCEGYVPVTEIPA